MKQFRIAGHHLCEGWWLPAMCWCEGVVMLRRDTKLVDLWGMAGEDFEIFLEKSALFNNSKSFKAS